MDRERTPCSSTGTSWHGFVERSSILAICDQGLELPKPSRPQSRIPSGQREVRRRPARAAAPERAAGSHRRDRVTTGWSTERFADDSFTDTFVLDEAVAAEFPEVDWASHIGSTATVTGSGTPTIWVMEPGR